MLDNSGELRVAAGARLVLPGNVTSSQSLLSNVTLTLSQGATLVTARNVSVSSAATVTMEGGSRWICADVGLDDIAGRDASPAASTATIDLEVGMWA